MREKIARYLQEYVLGKSWGGLSDYGINARLKQVDQILSIPITRSFPCPECGGTGGHMQDVGAQLPDGTWAEEWYPCPNSHCKDGQVEKTLCVIEIGEHCPKWHPWNVCDVKCPDEWPIVGRCVKKKLTPITHGSLPADMGKTEWRVM